MRLDLFFAGMLMLVIGIISVKWPRALLFSDAWKFKNPEPSQLYIRSSKFFGWLMIVFAIATMLDGIGLI